MTRACRPTSTRSAMWAPPITTPSTARRWRCSTSRATAWPRTASPPPPGCSEAAGAGACLITDHWEGVEMFLEPDEEVLVARDGQEVAAHLAALTPDRARAIGEAARRRVLAEHTYARRADRGRRPVPARRWRRVAKGAPHEPAAGHRGAGTEPVVFVGERPCGDLPGAAEGAGRTRGTASCSLSGRLPGNSAHRDLDRADYCDLQFYAEPRRTCAVRRPHHRGGRGRGRLLCPRRDRCRRLGPAHGQGRRRLLRHRHPGHPLPAGARRLRLSRAPSRFPDTTSTSPSPAGRRLERLERHHGSPAARALYCSADPDV
ncbi:MAG: glycosyltransferase [Brevundimonas sp.]|nr:glycosyltransferase [Brevundimonas sp.]